MPVIESLRLLLPCMLKDRRGNLREEEREIDWKANYKPISALGLQAGK